MVRGELEEPVEPQLGAALLSLAGPHTVEKKRHRHDGWEIDEYLGRHLGRAKAEYELDDETLELPAFPPGIEVLREITGVRGFSDRALALRSRYPEL
jgi:CYTH domain-containing protein